jgi:hypothetical protein
MFSFAISLRHLSIVFESEAIGGKSRIFRCAVSMQLAYALKHREFMEFMSSIADGHPQKAPFPNWLLPDVVE